MKRCCEPNQGESRHRVPNPDGMCWIVPSQAARSRDAPTQAVNAPPLLSRREKPRQASSQQTAARVTARYRLFHCS